MKQAVLKPLVIAANGIKCLQFSINEDLSRHRHFIPPASHEPVACNEPPEHHTVCVDGITSIFRTIRKHGALAETDRGKMIHGALVEMDHFGQG